MELSTVVFLPPVKSDGFTSIVDGSFYTLKLFKFVIW